MTEGCYSSFTFLGIRKELDNSVSHINLVGFAETGESE